MKREGQNAQEIRKNIRPTTAEIMKTNQNRMHKIKRSLGITLCDEI
jgi:hypothetical protein